MFHTTLLAAASLVTGCGDAEPRQWLVSVATDAPVPQLGDHLLLEVLGAEASCSECLRLIGVDGPESLPVSFGVLPRTQTGTVRVRARLYRAEQTGTDGLPEGTALIDAVGRLPPIEGETRVAFDLSARCFGVPSLLDEGKTCDPSTGAIAADPELPLLDGADPQPEAGSWPEAAPKACAGTVPQGMVCVPGGVFILGNPRPGFVVDSASESLPEHLVQVGAFAMDEDEVTVGVVRGLVAQGKLSTEPVARGSSKPDELKGACAYLGVGSAGDDALPINCLSRPLAEEVCVALGKRLPTEAEWEFAAGNRDSETPFPWGDGGDLCTTTVLGVGRKAGEIAETNGAPEFYENAGCRPVQGDSAWGPVAGGQPKDVTHLGLRNMAGNMGEWVADVFAPYSAACWQPEGTLLVNPRCKEGTGAQQLFSFRGSDWAGYKLAARAVARRFQDQGASPYVGLRCAVSM